MNPLILTTLLMNATSVAPDALPDISLVAGDLSTAYVSTSNSEFTPTTTRGLRFATASINLGVGRLELRGGAIAGSTQLVNQRVYRTDGTFWDRAAGTFTYHPTHGHIHFDDWTQFRLRSILPNEGVGPVVASGAKTSFCILEIRAVNTAAPGHATAPSYGSCGQLQGLRPGWADVYGASLSGQVINLTGVADGTYWLEGDIDPNNQVLESDETNNVVRIKVAIGPVPTAVPDAYEDNDTRTIVDAAPVGGANSPNLGLILNYKQINNLSMEDADDYYKIQIHAGQFGAYIQMESPYLQQSNLNMQLINPAGTVVKTATSSVSWENISLAGVAAGTYYVRVYRGTTTTSNPNYTLKVSPTPNNPPVLNLTTPVAGTRYVEKSLETFPINWAGSDPDSDPKTVSMFRSRTFGDNGAAEPITGYQNMPNTAPMVNMNTADFGLGTWYIMGAGTDGGAVTLSWAPGNVFIYIKGDVNGDGHVHMEDYKLAQRYFKTSFRLPSYNYIMDMNRDGVLTSGDLRLLLELAMQDDHD